MSSIRRLKLCSLTRLSRMSETLGAEIERLKNKVRTLEKECDGKLKDELKRWSIHKSWTISNNN